MRLYNPLFHIAANYIGWTGCMFLVSANKALAANLLLISVIFIQVIWQKFVVRETEGIFFLVLLFTITGFVVDSIFSTANYIQFFANSWQPYFSPSWMVLIWVSFSIVLYSSIKYIGQSYGLMSLLAGFAFPFSYAIGEKIGAATFVQHYKTGLLIGLVWAFMFPFLLYIYHRWRALYL